MTHTHKGARQLSGSGAGKGGRGMRIGTVIFDALKGIDRRDEMSEREEYLSTYQFDLMTYSYILKKIVVI